MASEKNPAAARATADMVVDRLLHVPDVRHRGMFGGYGIYSGDVMFALVTSAGDFFFRVGDTTQSDFEDAGMPRFHRMPYFEVPDDVVASDDLLSTWAQRALEQARLAKAKKPPKSKKKTAAKKTAAKKTAAKKSAAKKTAAKKTAAKKTAAKKTAAKKTAAKKTAAKKKSARDD